MKIALFHDLPSGGAKRSLYETVSRLSRGHIIDLFAPSTANEEFCSLLPHVRQSRFFPFSTGLRLQKPFGRMNNLFLLRDVARFNALQGQIAEQINHGQYDVALVHPSQWTQAPAILQYLQIPAVYYCHEPLRRLYETDWVDLGSEQTFKHQLTSKLDPLPEIVDGYVRRYDYRSARSATSIATNSNFTADEIKRIYLKEALVAYHGVDTDTFRPLDLPREPFVLSVGALLPHKGFDFLIRSLSKIPLARRPPLVLVNNMVSQKERQRLQTLASRYDVELQFQVQIPVIELVNLYNRCALVVYAPYREPFGLVPLEAMACATAVVAVREGGPAESIVNGETGLLVSRDEIQFAEAVMNLLSDLALRDKFGEQSLLQVQNRWTWEKAVNKMALILHDAAGVSFQQSSYPVNHYGQPEG